MTNLDTDKSLRGVLVRTSTPDIFLSGKPELPCGIGWLSESLDRHNIEHDVVDLNLDSFDYLLSKADNAEWIGISAVSPGYTAVYELLKKIRVAFPEIIIILGGPHAVSMRLESVCTGSNVNYYFVGEADDALPLFIKRGFTLEDHELVMSENCTESKSDAIYCRCPLVDISDITFPEYRHFDLSRYANVIPLSTSRGCSGCCTFCLTPRINGRPSRKRTVSSIISEIEFWYTQGYRAFSILDDNFAEDISRTEGIATSILQSGFCNLSLYCGIGLRADTLSTNLLSLLVKAGLKYLAVGVESADPNVLHNCCKEESIEEIRQAVINAIQLGVNVCMNFVIGLPGDNFLSGQETIKFAQELYPATSRFFHLVPYPGSAAYEWVSRNGVFNSSIDNWLGNANYWNNTPCFETSDFSINERKAIFDAGNKIGGRVWGPKGEDNNYGVV